MAETEFLRKKRKGSEERGEKVNVTDRDELNEVEEEKRTEEEEKQRRPMIQRAVDDGPVGSAPPVVE